MHLVRLWVYRTDEAAPPTKQQYCLSLLDENYESTKFWKTDLNNVYVRGPASARIYYAYKHNNGILND